jgi:predicted NBD/HSP70 family sugar kinase
LSQRSGLPLSTVIDTTAQMVAEGILLEEVASRSGRPGRPPTVLRLAAKAGIIALLTITRGGFEAGLVSLDGEIHGIQYRVFDFAAGKQDMTPVVDLLDDLLAGSGIGRADLTHTVLAVPAPVHQGRIAALRSPPQTPYQPSPTPRIQWIGTDPGAALGHLLSMPVTVENDANLEALGESVYGAAKGADLSLYVKMVGGLGAGVVMNRRLIRGAVGFAGELAHMHVDDEGPLCACGGRGCLGDKASIYDLVRLMQPAFDETLTLEKLAALSAARDQPTLRMLNDLGVLIGWTLGTACVLLNPAAIVIDGSLDGAVTPIIDGITEGIARTAPGAAFDALTITPGTLGRTAALFGAITLVTAPRLPVST